MSDKAYIYTHWSKIKRASKDFKNAIIPSIASLRRFTGDTVIVIDYVGVEWENFPRILDFHVVRKVPFFQGRNQVPLAEFQINVLSRNMDLLAVAKNVPQTKFIAVDSDILWMDQVGDDIDWTKMNILCRFGFNNGCYAFSKNEHVGRKFMAAVARLGCRAMIDPDLGRKINEIISHEVYLTDEATFEATFCDNRNWTAKQLKPFPYNGPVLKQHGWLNLYKNVHFISADFPLDIVANKCLGGLFFEETADAFELCLPESILRNVPRRPIGEVLAKGSTLMMEQLRTLRHQEDWTCLKQSSTDSGWEAPF